MKQGTTTFPGERRWTVAASALPWFGPLSAAGARLQPSLAALAGSTSHVMASQNGRLVLDPPPHELEGHPRVRLGVCNPVTAGCGGVDVLLPLRGRTAPQGLTSRFLPSCGSPA